MGDIGRDLSLIQWMQVGGDGDPLSQLLECRILQLLAQPLLANQEDLQQRAALDLQVGQHAQLFERVQIQILRLVDDQ